MNQMQDNVSEDQESLSYPLRDSSFFAWPPSFFSSWRWGLDGRVPSSLALPFVQSADIDGPKLPPEVGLDDGVELPEDSSKLGVEVIFDGVVVSI